MLISVLGDIIDTKNIYKISKVKGNNCWENNEELSHSGYDFYIHLYNQKNIRV
jgi:hypothetical protein